MRYVDVVFISSVLHLILIHMLSEFVKYTAQISIYLEGETSRIVTYVSKRTGVFTMASCIFKSTL